MDFSIIIPAKNEEMNIGRCLDSIFAIDYDCNRYEVLVVDNGSDDSTVDISKARGAQVFVKPGLTISALRNYGASHACGKMLSFLDADCTVEADWLTEAERYLHRMDIPCFGSPPMVPVQATWVQNAWFQVRKKKSIVENVEWLESMNMFVRSELFHSLGGFNESLVTCEDYDLSLRLRQRGLIVSDQRIRATHHGEAANLLHFYQKEKWRGTSNLKGLYSHGFDTKEVPSLIVPVVYWLLGLATMIMFSMNLSGLDLWFPKSYFFLLFVWQGPILFLAFWKSRPSFRTKLIMHLYLLLNVYFFARGRAMIPFK